MEPLPGLTLPYACIHHLSQPPSDGARLALQSYSRWTSGSVIRIAFLDGDEDLQKRVQSVALEWLNHANLFFAFGSRVSDADIRISFLADNSAWSLVGTQCRLATASDPTMNFGWVTPATPDTDLRAVVLHEFGHALGCLHEHQHPDLGIVWNVPVVEHEYGQSPNYWAPDVVQRNIFRVYSRTLTIASTPDPLSIMMYPFPERYTLNGFSSPWNTTLSALDQKFMRQVYP